MKLQTVFRIDPISKLVRLFRVVRTKGRVGDGSGYSSKTSIAIAPKLFGFQRGFHEWTLTLFGVRLHYVRSYGGIFAAILMAVVLALNTVGCASQVDPATGKTVIDVQATSDNVDILIDAAEFFAVASMKPDEYKKFELYAEFIRKTKDRVAARELLKQIQSGKVVVPPVAISAAPIPVK